MRGPLWENEEAPVGWECPGRGQGDALGTCPRRGELAVPSPGCGTGARCGHCHVLLLQELGRGACSAGLRPPGSPVRVSACLWLNWGLGCGRSALRGPRLPESCGHALAVGTLQTEVSSVRVVDSQRG